MAEEKKCGWKSCFLNYLIILVLIVIGTGIMAQWSAWTGYKVYSADQYGIKVYTQDGKEIDVPKGHEVKISRLCNRVEVFSSDKKKRDVYYNMTRIEMRPR
jgi:hypothetical protein